MYISRKLSHLTKRLFYIVFLCLGSLAFTSVESHPHSAVQQVPFHIFPNPVVYSFEVRFPPLVDKVQLTLFDVLGKKVHHQLLTPSQNKVDVSSLSKGVYVASLETNRGHYSIKLVKQR